MRGLCYDSNREQTPGTKVYQAENSAKERSTASVSIHFEKQRIHMLNQPYISRAHSTHNPSLRAQSPSSPRPESPLLPDEPLAPPPDPCDNGNADFELDHSELWAQVLASRALVMDSEGDTSTEENSDESFVSLPDSDADAQPDEDGPLLFNPATYGISQSERLREEFLVKYITDGMSLLRNIVAC